MVTTEVFLDDLVVNIITDFCVAKQIESHLLSVAILLIGDIFITRMKMMANGSYDGKNYGDYDGDSYIEV